MLSQAEQEYYEAVQQLNIAWDKFLQADPQQECVDMMIHQLNLAELRVRTTGDQLRARGGNTQW